MASLTLTIADEHVPRIRRAFHPSQDGVQEATVDEIRQVLLEYVRRRVIRLEASAAQEAAWQAVASEVAAALPDITP